MFIGTTSIALNRPSGALTLAGLTSVTSTSFFGALTGNADTATTLATTRAINGVNFNGGAAISIPRISAIDDRIIEPSAATTGFMTVNFTSWDNNNNSPYADALHFRTYTDSSGGSDNLVMFRKNAIGMRIWQHTYGAATPYATFKDVAFTDSNVASATILQNARTIAISGPITGTATSFNGSADITIPVTALNVGHANLTGIMDVDHGGTGLSTVTVNRIMYGNGTSAMQTSANLTFNGSTLTINGTLEATEKSFNIAHPTQPGKRLIYGVLEGPEHAVYCRGTVKDDVIELPEE